MVYYFTSNVVNPPAKLYMGRDKQENEELIRWGWPEDVWFHVDKLSSAHVYLRLNSDQSIDDISKELIQDCCQLVKANSIEGNKQNNINVVYTMWSNLKKSNYMEVGQVGFHDEKRVCVEKRINEVVNRLNKTKIVDENVDLQEQRKERDVNESRKQKEQQRILRIKETAEREAKEKEKQERSYDRVFVAEKMKTNKEDGNISDDFM